MTTPLAQHDTRPSATDSHATTGLAAADCYAALNDALAALPTRPDAVHQAVVSLVRLGLNGPAREIVSDVRWRLLDRPEYRDLMRQLSASPGGRVSWASLQARFDRACAALVAARPEMAVHEAVWRAMPSRLEMYRSLDGNHHLFARHESGPLEGLLRPVAPLMDVRGAVAQMKMPHDPRACTCHPYVICDDRFGALLARVFAATGQMLHSFAPRIYLIEPNPSAIGVTLYVCDESAALCHARAGLFVGDDCVERFLGALAGEYDRELPMHVLGLPAFGDAQSRVLAGLRDLARQRGALASDALQAARNHYAALPARHWAERFAGASASVKLQATTGTPNRAAVRTSAAAQPSNNSASIRILGITSRFTTVLQYAMRDLRAAFERRGHVFHTLIEPSDHDTLTPLAITRAINELRPDLAVAIDHTRAGQRGLFPDGLPFVCWIQDLLPHLTDRRAGESIGPLEFYIAPELHLFVDQYRYPADRGMAWTLATDAEMYGLERLPESALAPHRCDVSYVSNQSQTPESFCDEFCERTMGNNAGGRALCRWLFEALQADVAGRGAAPPSATILLRRAQQEAGITCHDAAAADMLARNFIHPLGELLFRQTALTWVADYCERAGRSLRIYGRGWEAHPRLSRHARGVAANGPELRAVYQASAVNLQINGYGAVHPRLLDGLAAGGFFLIRDCPMDRLHAAVAALLEAVQRFEREGRGEVVPGRALHAGECGELLDRLGRVRLLRGLPHEASETFSITGEELRFCLEAESNGFRRMAGAVFADFDRVTFDSPGQLAERLEQYLSDPAERTATALRMRTAVVQRFTYDGLVDALLAFLADRTGRDASK